MSRDHSRILMELCHLFYDNFKKVQGILQSEEPQKSGSFLSFCLVPWENRQKLIMVCSPFWKISRFLSLGVLRAFCLREKVFNLSFSGIFLFRAFR